MKNSWLVYVDADTYVAYANYNQTAVSGGQHRVLSLIENSYIAPYHLWMVSWIGRQEQVRHYFYEKPPRSLIGIVLNLIHLHSAWS